MDHKTVTEAATQSAGIVKRAAQSIWKFTRAFGAASPRIAAALLIIAAVSLPPLAYFGVVRAPSPDTIMQTQLDGAAAEIKAIKADISLLASQSDLAELRAIIAAQPKPAAPLATGSISKPKK